MNNWQPIKTAPKDGTEILLLTFVRWNDDKPYICNYKFDVTCRIWRNSLDSWLQENSPDFWMPMIEAPESDNEIEE